ncbi:hypothetical protein HDU93_004664 [Gonapodya sp. JEL0774]|nr:hypothetical protein HDU93_004664 [Gonapodya sp. JEL0774]
MQTTAHRFTLVDTTGGMPNANASSASLPNVPVIGDLPAHLNSEHVVHHEIKELGTHILVCSVHYTPNSSLSPSLSSSQNPPTLDRRSFRKFYKFQVSNPLSVRTKVHSTPDGRVFLEAQVQNVAQVPMFVERMRFEANPVFEYKDLNYVWCDTGGRAKGGAYAARAAEGTKGKRDGIGSTAVESPASDPKSNSQPRHSGGEIFHAVANGALSRGLDSHFVAAGSNSAGGLADRLLNVVPSVTTSSNLQSGTPTSLHIESVFGSSNILHPTDVRQYLYLLYPRPDQPLTTSLVAATLGKLDIQWRGPMGEIGRLQTSQLGRKVPVLDALEVLPVEVHGGSVVVLERAFRCKLRVRNNNPSDAMRIVVHAPSKKLMGSVLLRGPSTYNVGDVVSGGGTREWEMEFVPVVAGLHRIGGFRVQDLISGLSKEVDGVCEVFVVVGDPEL